MGRIVRARRERPSRLSPAPRRPAGPSSTSSFPHCLSRLPRAAARLVLGALLLVGAGTAAADQPTVSNVEITSSPQSGTSPKKYGGGEKIQFTVTFEEAVTVTSDPEYRFSMDNSGCSPCEEKRAAYVSGSTTSALVFEYTVVSADRDNNGIFIYRDAMRLDSDDSIRATNGGEDARITISVGPSGTQSGHKVDGSLSQTTNTPPTASNNTVETKEDTEYTFQSSDFNFTDTDANDELDHVIIVSLPGSGSLKVDGKALVEGDLPEDISKGEIDDDDLLTYEPPSDANGDDYATFTFKVNDGDDDSASAYTMTIDVDSVPDVTDVSVTSTPRSGTATPPDTYGAGEKIQVTATFDEAVTVTDDPHVEVVVGANTRDAAYASGSGSTALVFEYTVVSGDTDSDGIAVNADVKLDTDSGSEDHIRDGNSNDADVTFTALAAQSAHQVDGSVTPPPACPSGQPAHAFWTACLTIGKGTVGGATVYGYDGHTAGALSDTDFTYKEQTFTVTLLSREGAAVDIYFNAILPGSERLVLQVGATSLIFQGGVRFYTWTTPSSLAWTDANVGDKVSVSLREYVAPRDDSNNEYVISGVPYWEDRENATCVTGAPPYTYLEGGDNPDNHGCWMTVDEEGGAETFRVRMKYPVREAVTVTLSPRDSGAISVSPAQLTFTPDNWHTDQEVSVSGLADADGLDEWDFIYLTGETGANTGSVRVEIKDDDTHAQTGHSLIYNSSGNRLRVAQGGTGQTFTVRLSFQPEATTTLVWDPLVAGPVKPVGGGNTGIKVFKETTDSSNPPQVISAAGGVAITPREMVFTRDNWQTPQAFTVTADADTAGTVIPLRPWWETSQYPYTKSPEFTIEVVTTLATALPDPPPLSAAAGDRAVRLSWTVPEDAGGITGWQARYGEVNPRNAAVDWGEWYTIPGAEADAASHTVTGLANGTSYGFQVRAVVGGLETSPSNTHLAMPMAGMTLDAPGRPELDAYSGNAAVDLSWEAPRFAGTITGWQYRYGLLDGPTNTVDWGDWTDIGDATAQTRSHTVTGLVNDTEYGFQLRAVAGENAGDMSERQTAWPYHPPIERISVTEVTATTVGLEWVLPQDAGLTGVRVEHRLPEQEWQSSEDLALDAASYTVTGLAPATRHNFRVVLDSPTGGTSSGVLAQDTLAADPLDARMTGSVPEPDDGTPQAETPAQGCRVDVGVRFLDADGNAVAVESLAASDFTATNGQVGAPVADAGGLSWTVPAWAAPGFTGLMRVRLTETGRWQAAEQVFRVAGDTDCAPVARNALASLALDGLDLDQAFDAATTAYAADAPADMAEVTVTASAVYGAATVAYAPADADGETEGHQVALAEGETAVTVTVTPADGSAAQTWTVTVTRAAGAGVLTGFELVDASTDTDLGAVSDGGTVTVSAAGSYGIRAGVEDNATVGSVVLTLAGPGADDLHEQTEGIAPYSLYGDAEGAEHGRALAAGSYTLTATAHAEGGGAGEELGTLTAAFTVEVEAAPMTPPPPEVLTGFTLLDASDQSTVAALSEGADIDLGGRSGGSFAIRADVAPDATVGSVALSLSGAKTVSRTENIAPYSLWGDHNDGNGGRALDGASLPAGSYTLSATAHAGRGASGTVLGTLSVSFEVLAPPALSVADAEVREGPGAALDFAVTLDRSSTGTVTVAYATADGTATAGSDYTSTSGTLTFAPGDTLKTVSVPVLEDGHDDDGETMALRLSSPAGAVIADGEATGTIANEDPMPQAWLARYGRTVAEQAVAAVRDRMATDRTPGFRGRIAGEALPDGTATADMADDPLAVPALMERERRAFLALLPGDGAGGDGPESRTGTAEEAMLGTAFEIARETEGGLSLGFWGRAAMSGFAGRDGDLDLDGEAATAMLGTDWKRRDATFGLMLFRSRGEGGWRSPDGSGTVGAGLGGVVPWAGRTDGRRSLWGAAGTGRGEMTLTDGQQDTYVAGLGWSMAAAGAEGALGGGGAGWRADAVAGDAGRLSAATGETARLRFGLEAAWETALASGAVLSPRLEAGLSVFTQIDGALIT